MLIRIHSTKDHRIPEQVVKILKEQELLPQNINVEYDRQRSLGEIMADRLADFGGSWLFIGIFCGENQI